MHQRGLILLQEERIIQRVEHFVHRMVPIIDREL